MNRIDLDRNSGPLSLKLFGDVVASRWARVVPVDGPVLWTRDNGCVLRQHDPNPERLHWVELTHAVLIRPDVLPFSYGKGPSTKKDVPWFFFTASDDEDWSCTKWTDVEQYVRGQEAPADLTASSAEPDAMVAAVLDAAPDPAPPRGHGPPERLRPRGPCDWLTVGEAARTLRMRDASARSWLRERKLIHSAAPGKAKVNAGELSEAMAGRIVPIRRRGPAAVPDWEDL